MSLLLELFSHQLTKHVAWIFLITKYEIYLKDIDGQQFPSFARSCTPGEGNFNATFRVLFPFSCQPKHFLNKLCLLILSWYFYFIWPWIPCLTWTVLKLITLQVKAWFLYSLRQMLQKLKSKNWKRVLLFFEWDEISIIHVFHVYHATGTRHSTHSSYWTIRV